MKKKAILAVTCFVALASGAFAQDTIQGVPAFVVGDDRVIPFGFDPGAKTNAERVYDDGVTNGDSVAGDNIFTGTITFGPFVPVPPDTRDPLPAGSYFNTKIASAGYSPVNAPSSGDVGAIVPATSSPVRFFIKTTPFGDGFTPDVAPGPWEDGFVWNETIAPYVAAAYALAPTTAVKATGNFQGQLGGNDFQAGTAGAVVLSDQTDDVYQGTVTGLSAGNYEFKIVINESFDNGSFGQLGFAGGGANLNFTSTSTSDIITITLDAKTGRTRAFNPAASPGPPFFAQSSAWSTGLTPAEELTDNGDGTHSRDFLVAAPGTYGVRVAQGVGRGFPDTGNYPITVEAPNTTVRVIFDTNTYTDGYLPASDFVVVLDATTGQPLNRYVRTQVVGNFQVPFGAPLGSNFNANLVEFELADNGVGNDTQANDEIHTLTLTTFENGTNVEIKAVGNRNVTNPDDTNGYTIQFGGPLDGTTIFGNNTNGTFSYATPGNTVFKVDTVTGRVGAGAEPFANPTRGAYITFSNLGAPGAPFDLNPITHVEDWMTY